MMSFDGPRNAGRLWMADKHEWDRVHTQQGMQSFRGGKGWDYCGNAVKNLNATESRSAVNARYCNLDGELGRLN